MHIVKRLHKCSDGVWKYAPNHAATGAIRLQRLDAEAKPVGAPAVLAASGCVHFEYEPE